MTEPTNYPSSSKEKILLEKTEYRKKPNGYALYESLACTFAGNMFLEEELNKINIKSMFIVFVTLLAYINIGIFTGLVGSTINIAIHEIWHYKSVFLRTSLKNYTEDDNFYMPLLCWIATSALPVMVSSVLVTYIEPTAAGSGIPVMKSHLNGVNLENSLRLQTLLVKCAGLICALVGGLPGGNEGPMIHVGGIVGALVCDHTVAIPFNFCKYVRYFKDEFFKYEFILSGVAAGVGSGFGAPIGGVLLALEEAANFWSNDLILKMTISSTISAFLTTLICSHVYKYQIYGVFRTEGIETIEYEYFEFPIFALVGVTGGLLGALWNELNFRLNMFRFRWIKPKWLKVIEAVMFSTLFTCVAYGMVISIEECVPKPSNMKKYPVLNCEEGQHKTMERLWFYLPGDNIRDLLLVARTGQSRIMTLGIFAIVYFTGSSACTGISVTVGGFLPNLFLGAVWGRWLGDVAREYIPKQSFMTPGKYALIGAAAQLSGVMRMTVSLSVILVEVTGITPRFVLPLIVVVVFAKWTGDLFNMDVSTKGAKKFPLLPWAPPECCFNRQVNEIMSKNPICLLKREKVNYVYGILSDTRHNGFPIVEGATPDIPRPLQEDMDLTIDLTKFMTSPIRIYSHTYVPEIYGFFRGLGLRHIVVVNGMNNVVGIITRKDFMCE